jgi:hypothetical protein
MSTTEILSNYLFLNHDTSKNNIINFTQKKYKDEYSFSTILDSIKVNKIESQKKIKLNNLLFKEMKLI